MGRGRMRMRELEAVLLSGGNGREMEVGVEADEEEDDKAKGRRVKMGENETSEVCRFPVNQIQAEFEDEEANDRGEEGHAETHEGFSHEEELHGSEVETEDYS
jgi:hypothetical protein